MSDISSGAELYAFLAYTGQYKEFTINDCDVLVRSALGRFHASLYTDGTDLIYDSMDGVFCVSPRTLLYRLVRMVRAEYDRSFTYEKGKLMDELSELEKINFKVTGGRKICLI